MNQILIEINQILIKILQIVKIHVERIQERHFLKIKIPRSEIIQDLGAEKNVDTSRFWTRKTTIL